MSDILVKTLNHPEMIRNYEKSLRRSRATRLGPVETVHMWVKGKGDGKRSLPYKDADGIWKSPAIDREQDSYQEFCDNAWGTAQIRAAALFEKAKICISETERNVRLLINTREELAFANGPVDLTERKSGEEGLTDDVVIARRKREYSAALAPLKGKIAELEHAVREGCLEISRLCSRAEEAGNNTRHICERVLEHSRLRISAYADAAMSRHPEKNNIRVILPPPERPQAEILFDECHEEMASAAAQVLEESKRLLANE